MIEAWEKLRNFTEAATQWYQLSHPHVAKLFAACHVGYMQFFVYESVFQGKHLNEYLKLEANRSATWKCLVDAALGLQYLHNRKVIHSDLRSENIIVGSDSVAKLCGVRVKHTRILNLKRVNENWIAPELADLFTTSSGKTLATDIYTFGMCIWEAVTLALPWKDTSWPDIQRSLGKELFPNALPVWTM